MGGGARRRVNSGPRCAPRPAPAPLLPARRQCPSLTWFPLARGLKSLRRFTHSLSMPEPAFDAASKCSPVFTRVRSCPPPCDSGPDSSLGAPSSDNNDTHAAEHQPPVPPAGLPLAEISNSPGRGVGEAKRKHELGPSADVGGDVKSVKGACLSHFAAAALPLRALIAWARRAVDAAASDLFVSCPLVRRAGYPYAVYCAANCTALPGWEAALYALIILKHHGESLLFAIRAKRRRGSVASADAADNPLIEMLKTVDFPVEVREQTGREQTRRRR